MKIRYIISEKWEVKNIVKAVQAVEFALDYLELEPIRLCVKLINSCDQMGTSERIKSKRYEIRISSDADLLLETIFHEIFHIKQFVEDGLRPSNNGWLFRGQHYMLNSVEDYLLAPWEMEARAMEEVMLAMYFEKY